MYIKKNPMDYSDCAVRIAIDILSTSWNAWLIQEINNGIIRPSDLHRTISVAPKRVLTKQIFANSELKPETVNNIIISFKESFKQFKSIAESLIEFVSKESDTEKSCFLLALAVANEIFSVSSFLWQYSDNLEYLCECPHCKNEIYLWNQNNSLVAYRADPVSNKN